MVSRQTLVKKRKAYVRALDDALETITTTLQSRPDVEKAILFGGKSCLTPPNPSS